MKQLLIDSLNGFSADLIPFFLFQLFSAALMAFVLQFIANRKFGKSSLDQSVLLATVIAFIASVSKYMLPFSVLGAAIILLLLKKQQDSKQQIFTILTAAIGLGCGTGSIIQTGLAFIVVLPIIFLMPTQVKSE